MAPRSLDVPPTSRSSHARSSAWKGSPGTRNRPIAMKSPVVSMAYAGNPHATAATGSPIAQNEMLEHSVSSPRVAQTANGGNTASPNVALPAASHPTPSRRSTPNTMSINPLAHTAPAKGIPTATSTAPASHAVANIVQTNLLYPSTGTPSPIFKRKPCPRTQLRAKPSPQSVHANAAQHRQCASTH